MSKPHLFDAGSLRKRVVVIHFVTYIGFCLAFWCSLQFEAIAQSGARPDRGLSPLGSYAVSDIDNVNLTNGNLNLSIPLASLPPMAGGKLTYTIQATYNSKIWDVVRSEFRNEQPSSPIVVVDKPQRSDAGGWRLRVGYRLEFRSARSEFDWVQPTSGDPDQAILQQGWYKTFLVMPDGSEHELRPLGYQSCMPLGNRDFLKGYYFHTPYTVTTGQFWLSGNHRITPNIL